MSRKEVMQKGKKAKAAKPAPQVTHQEYAASNGEFKAACAKVGLQPSSRQASKWRRKFGKAWTEGRGEE